MVGSNGYGLACIPPSNLGGAGYDGAGRLSGLAWAVRSARDDQANRVHQRVLRACAAAGSRQRRLLTAADKPNPD